MSLKNGPIHFIEFYFQKELKIKSEIQNSRFQTLQNLKVNTTKGRLRIWKRPFV